MNMCAVTLIIAGALHLHQHDRTDIAVLIGLQSFRLFVQCVQTIASRSQRTLPVRSLARIQIDRHFDHALTIELQAGNFGQQVLIAGLTPDFTCTFFDILGCGSQLQDKARVKTIKRLECEIRDCLVSLVHHHHRTDCAQGIAEGILNR
ncbi:MAG: hypothetical protein M2R46_05494 [Verrucomicrobia subdivision 3 bacterium]|nr:hypothetical protein [Limisphaerales bacterium]